MKTEIKRLKKESMREFIGKILFLDKPKGRKNRGRKNR